VNKWNNVHFYNSSEMEDLISHFSSVYPWKWVYFFIVNTDTKKYSIKISKHM